MSGVRTISASADGALPGVRVVAIEGQLHADATPGRAAPVYVDEGYHLLRIVEAKRTPTGWDVLVETASPPLPQEGELPGYATRIGPWPARLHDHVVVLGPAEIAAADRLRPRHTRPEPVRVEPFVRWLRSRRRRDDALGCELVDDGVTWYATQAESLALFERIHRVVRDDLWAALREGSSDKIEEQAFRLSRAALADEDIWLAGAALRRADSLDWEAVIREGLQLPEGRDLTEELAAAERRLDHPPPALVRRDEPSPPLAYTHRTGLRERARPCVEAAR